jgi:hypothetical protein
LFNSFVICKHHYFTKGVYRISGNANEEFDCLSIEAEHLEKLPVAEDARYREVA